MGEGVDEDGRDIPSEALLPPRAFDLAGATLPRYHI